MSRGAARTARRRAAVLLTVGLGFLAVTGCGSSGQSGPSATSANSATHLSGLILRPLKPAPALTLRDYTGRPVSLASLRHHAVFVTFVYTHCPDVCPLIVASLAAAQRQLGARARSVHVLAVTVDPRRDTPAAIRGFLAARDAVGRMDYLLGSRAALLRVWRAWDVAVTTDGRRVTSGHSALVYGVSGGGKLAVVYPSNVTPAQIAHDAPLLASE
ncbi:MAG: SCO family protein [Solirubrobacteraceae bacterium]